MGDYSILLSGWQYYIIMIMYSEVIRMQECLVIMGLGVRNDHFHMNYSDCIDSGKTISN